MIVVIDLQKAYSMTKSTPICINPKTVTPLCSYEISAFSFFPISTLIDIRFEQKISDTKCKRELLADMKIRSISGITVRQ
jgi:hypothetical protein